MKNLRDPIASVFLVVLILMALSVSHVSAGPLRPSGLRCEYAFNPIGIDVPKPRFSWVLEHTERGQAQSAYQILVATDPSILDQDGADQWDSGKVASEQSTHVVYGGKPLASGRTYYWKVRSWDENGSVSPYSQIAYFEMGLMSPNDWKGRWIGGGGLLRKEFEIKGSPRLARAYISGLGYYELRINGKKVGDNALDPGWTTYEKRVLYTVYDVTGFLKPGSNALGVMLGKGWYGSTYQRRDLHGAEPKLRGGYPPTLILQLNIELEGGGRLSLVSDPSWKAAKGPIISDSIYDGEVYDARLEMPGWDRPGFDDSDWSAAQVMRGPGGVLSASAMEPIKVVDTIVPVGMTNPRPGTYVFDMGQNISGWAKLRVSGPRGTQVTMRYAESIYDDGMINQENLRRAKAQDAYILRGDGLEVYEPRFTYHGFRYVEITGYPGTPTLDTIRGQVVHTAVRMTGGFACSNQLLNDLHRNILWTQKTNLHSVPTDCPQRDERMGWMGDAHLSAEEAIYNFDMARFYANFIRNILDVQDPSTGTITDTVPHIWGSRPADPAWGAAYPLLCWYMYQYYGDLRILEENYEGLKRYLEYLRGRSQENLLTYSYYGDWIATEKTPGELVSTAFYLYSAQVISEIAKALEKSEDARRYSQLAEQVKDAFNRRFLDPETGNYANGTQAANSFALFLGVVPKEHRGRVIGNLVANIVYTHDTHLTTGIMGTKYLMELLTDLGRSDLAYELATQTSYPSWGYMLSKGATTVWELWQHKTGPAMNSHNHPALGSVGAWLYKALAGIRVDPSLPGFKRILIRPQIVRDLRWASASVQTLRGLICSSWSRSEGKINLEVVVPVNSDAEVAIPKAGMRDVAVREGGKLVWEKGRFVAAAAGIISASEDDNAVTLRVGSGRYSLELTGE